MGLEVLYGLGAAILLGAIAYGMIRASRRVTSAASREATRKNFDKA